jgi:hypothetical protein
MWGMMRMAAGKMYQCMPALAAVIGLFAMGGYATWVAVGSDSIDFSVYYVVAKAHTQGLNIYTITESDRDAIAEEAHINLHATRYFYPPLTAGIVSLFVNLSYRQALILWIFLSLGTVFVSGCVLSQVTERQWFSPLVFGALALYVPIYTTLHLGQINNFVLMATCLYLLFLKNRRTYAASTAMCIGIMLKPITSPLLIHSIWRRDSRKILAAISGLVVALLLCILLTGTDSTIYYFQHIIDISRIENPLSKIDITFRNQSLLAFFGRLFYAQNGSMHFLHGGPEAARVITYSIDVALVLIVAILTWPGRCKEQQAETFRLETGLILVTANLIAPTTWSHHLVISAIPLILGWYASRTSMERISLCSALFLLLIGGVFWRRLNALNPVFLGPTGTYAMLIIFAVASFQLYRAKGVPWISRSSLGAER